MSTIFMPIHPPWLNNNFANVVLCNVHTPTFLYKNYGYHNYYA